ncbi:GAF and ANTAR domain-containing protein [Mycobacterium sp. EPa45]|uniref:GAF and ANTAR domain-containing protein n=1 Tax=Mycobacterium sp. EPa45 TaxID=1545728 RepID=UPI0006419037|nr:GAF and ANTAR domain-containing protein [Mycobacterium sp. EPa45]AKK26135.1 transcriptional regulator [Mycobacterium sp. EPa45]
MSENLRETRVLSAVVSLVDSLLDDFDVVDLLTELTERCAELLDIASAGFLLADPLQRLHLLAATSDRTRDLELFQLQAEEGPCIDCYRTGEPVLVADLGSQIDRWPRFVAAAQEAGFASVHALPMRAAGVVLGALGLFDTRRGELTEADVLVAQTLAHIACVAVLQEHSPRPDTVVSPLRSAVTGRIVVEQAKGFVSEVLGVSMDEAFRLLRTHSRGHGEHLTDVARALMRDRHTRPELIRALTELTRDRH